MDISNIADFVNLTVPIVDESIVQFGTTSPKNSTPIQEKIGTDTEEKTNIDTVDNDSTNSVVDKSRGTDPDFELTSTDATVAIPSTTDESTNGEMSDRLQGIITNLEDSKEYDEYVFPQFDEYEIPQSKFAGMKRNEMKFEE